MRPFSPRMFPNLVALLSLDETQDSALGVVEGFPPPGAGLPCHIGYSVPASGRGRAGFAAEGETGITYAIIAFPADPGARKGDRFQPLNRMDSTPFGLPLRALDAATPQDAEGFLWAVGCESIE